MGTHEDVEKAISGLQGLIAEYCERQKPLVDVLLSLADAIATVGKYTLLFAPDEEPDPSKVDEQPTKLCPQCLTELQPGNPKYCEDCYDEMASAAVQPASQPQRPIDIPALSAALDYAYRCGGQGEKALLTCKGKPPDHWERLNAEARAAVRHLCERITLQPQRRLKDGCAIAHIGSKGHEGEFIYHLRPETQTPFVYKLHRVGKVGDPKVEAECYEDAPEDANGLGEPPVAKMRPIREYKMRLVPVHEDAEETPQKAHSCYQCLRTFREGAVRVTLCPECHNVTQYIDTLKEDASGEGRTGSAWTPSPADVANCAYRSNNGKCSFQAFCMYKNSQGDCSAPANTSGSSPDTEPFNADRITPDNFEGFRRVRKKPVIVHALQMNFPEGFAVTTPEGIVRGKAGDYLMVGVKGEKYPCRKDIFEATYDVLKDNVPDDPAEGSSPPSPAKDAGEPRRIKVYCLQASCASEGGDGLCYNDAIELSDGGVCESYQS